MAVERENKIVFDLSAIKAIRLRCKKCGGELTHATKLIEVKEHCPHCGEEWIRSSPTGWKGRTHDFVEALKKLRNEKQAPLVTIMFEIEGDE